MYYIIIPLIVLAVAALGGRFTSHGLRDWYRVINKPDLTPPGWFIGLVWTIIYFFTAFSAILFWEHGDTSTASLGVVLLFLVNAFINVYWTYLFFQKHFLGLAVVESVLLEITIVGLICGIYPYSMMASWLLWPYAVWVAFATFLNYSIYKLNPKI